MSKLQDLIAELCPNGVEYRKLGDCARRNKGINITAGQMKKIDCPTGPIRIFAGGNTIANVLEKDVPKNAIINKPSIIVKSRGNIGFEYYCGPFTHKNEIWSYSDFVGDVHIKYVYYILQNNVQYFQNKAKANSVKLAQLVIADTEDYEIPIPPLPVQEEIVKILDRFAEYTAELQAELQARKEQYEYYRNLLLTFNPSASGYGTDDEQKIKDITVWGGV
jgi:type I restriction enzyme S subunit